MSNAQVATGTVEGTGAALNIELGFTPKAVRIDNVDGLVQLFWNDDMPDASGIKQITAGTLSWITSNGVTPYAGSDTPGSEETEGFTIGADADVNVSAETIYWTAWGGENA